MRVHPKDRELLAQLTRQIVAEQLVRSFMNAAALVDSANALIDRGHYGVARSLAINAREEIGKGCTAASFLAGQMSEDEFVSTLRSHKYKQAEGLILPMIAIALKGMPQLSSLLPSPDASVPEAVGEMWQKVQNESGALLTALSPMLDLLRSLRELAEQGIDEEARQAGIYVTLKASEDGAFVEYPQQIARTDAEKELARFDLLLTHLADAEGRLPADLWTDDESAKRWMNTIETIDPRMFSHGAE